jgi:deoxycytidylate deaminase
MDKKIIKALNKATLRSTHIKHMTGCVIVDKKGKIISNGCAHTSSFRINQLNSIHAEIHALGRGRYKNLDGAIVYVQTIARKSGNVTLAKPCLTCAIALRTAGIKEVIYTIGFRGPFVDTAILDLEEDLSHLKVYPRGRNVS